MMNAYFSGTTDESLRLSYDEGCVWNWILNFAVCFVCDPDGWENNPKGVIADLELACGVAVNP